MLTNSKNTPPLWTPLLFRQMCLLAFIAGILSSRALLPGILAFFVLTLANFERIKRLFVFLFVAICMAGGFLYASMKIPEPPDFSGHWIQEAVQEDGLLYKKGIRVSAKIDDVSAMPAGRLRIILSEVRPVATEWKNPLYAKIFSGQNPPLPIPGKLVLTWQSPDFYASPVHTESSMSILAGQTLIATLRIRSIHGLANKGGMDSEAYWQEQDIWNRAWTSKMDSVPEIIPEESFMTGMRESLRVAVYKYLPRKTEIANNEEKTTFSEGAGFIPALLFGDRYLLSPEALDLFGRSTLSHSLALSGLHLGYAAAIGYVIARLLFLFAINIPHLPMQKMNRRKLEISCALIPAGLYIWLGAAQPSLVRAGLMLLFCAILLWLHKPKILLDALLWAVGLILIFDPSALFDLRLQLSALSIAAIAFAAPLLDITYAHLAIKDKSARIKKIHDSAPVTKNCLYNKVLRSFIYLMGASFIIQVILQPLTLKAFGLIGLSFPLNLLWLPILGLIVIPAAFAGLAASTIGLGVVATYCFQISASVCEYLLAFLNFIDSINLMPAPLGLRPEWPVVAGFWILIICIPMLFLKNKTQINVLILALTAFFLITVPTAAKLLETRASFVRLSMIDVGQGQAILVEWVNNNKHGRLMLDGGGTSSQTFDTGQDIIAPLLTDGYPPRLDYIINSHPDLDHLRGLVFLTKKMQVKNFAWNGTQSDGKYFQSIMKILQKKKINAHVWQRHDIYSLSDELKLHILHPDAIKNTDQKNSNNNALVIRMDWRGTPLALFCGDIEKGGINNMLKNSEASLFSAQVLVLPHHGAASSFNEKFYDLVNPSLALVSSGYNNQWNFPSSKVTTALEKRDIPLINTAVSGQITVEWRDGPEEKNRVIDVMRP